MKRKQYFLFVLFGWAFRVVFTLLFMTCRVRVFGREIETRYLGEHPGKSLLYASWHRGLAFFVYFFRNLNFIVMSSASRDGELATQVVRRFGWIPVRGSSRARGSEALREMEAYVAQGYRGGLVVDAPTGPPYVSKVGIIVLAKRTGTPILPVMWAADRYWRLKSWDRSIIPKPFSRVNFLYHDEVFHVPSDADRAECETARAKLDEILRAMSYCVDHSFHDGTRRDPREIDVPDRIEPEELHKRFV